MSFPRVPVFFLSETQKKTQKILQESPEAENIINLFRYFRISGPLQIPRFMQLETYQSVGSCWFLSLFLVTVVDMANCYHQWELLSLFMIMSSSS